MIRWFLAIAILYLKNPGYCEPGDWICANNCGPVLVTEIIITLSRLCIKSTHG